MKTIVRALIFALAVGFASGQTRSSIGDDLKLTLQRRIERDALLVDNYKDLPILVESVEDNDFGLTESAVQTRSELRMRSAQLRPLEFKADHQRYLYVNVQVTGPAYVVRIEFYRVAEWKTPDGPATTFVPTWSKQVAGTHGRSSSYVIDVVECTLDPFLKPT